MIVCFVRGGWFVLIGLNFLVCYESVLIRSGSSLMVVGGVGLVILSSLMVVWILGVRLLGCLTLVVLLTHGDVGLDHVYGLLGCGLF